MLFFLKICLLSFICVPFCVAEVYITVEKVDLDRCASAWFIKRFIDPDAEFQFIPQGEMPVGGVTYDFYGADYFHKGQDCTFTALIKSHNYDDIKALRDLNDQVNDVLSWRWPPHSFPIQLRRHISKLREWLKDDEAVYIHLFSTFDLFYFLHDGPEERMHSKQQFHANYLSTKLQLPLLAADQAGEMNLILEQSNPALAMQNAHALKLSFPGIAANKASLIEFCTEIFAKNKGDTIESILWQEIWRFRVEELIKEHL